MRIGRANYGGIENEVSVADAVAAVCTEEREGSLEEIVASQRATIEFLGRLVQQLHSSGALPGARLVAALNQQHYAKYVLLPVAETQQT